MKCKGRSTIISSAIKSSVNNTDQAKCRVGIMRQSKAGGSGSAFQIYVDDIKITTIKNGGTVCLPLNSG